MLANSCSNGRFNVIFPVVIRFEEISKKHQKLQQEVEERRISNVHRSMVSSDQTDQINDKINRIIDL